MSDNGCTLVTVKNLDKLKSKTSYSCLAKYDWYTLAGFVICGLKSKLMGIGWVPNSITVAACEVKDKNSINFMVMTICSDLKWNLHVEKHCTKIRFAANRISNPPIPHIGPSCTPSIVGHPLSSPAQRVLYLDPTQWAVPNPCLVGSFLVHVQWPVFHLCTVGNPS